MAPNTPTETNLLDAFTKIESNNGKTYYPTALAQDLLRYVGIDVIQFRRNQHVAYATLETSKKAIEGINELIQGVENSTTESWDSFKKYQDSVPVVEKILFELADLTGLEAQLYLFSGADVYGCVANVNTWEERRAKLRGKKTELFTEECKIRGGNTSDTESKEAAKLDDILFFENLCNSIGLKKPQASSESGWNPRSRIMKHIQTVIEAFKKPATSFRTLCDDENLSDFVTSALKSAFVIDGILGIAKDVDHLQSDEVWSASRHLAQHVRSGKEEYSTGGVAHANLKAHYEAFLKIIGGDQDLNLLAPYLKILALAGRVRRQYGSRTFCLAGLCQELYNKYGQMNEATKKQNVNKLMEIYEDSISLLTEAHKKYEDHSTYEAVPAEDPVSTKFSNKKAEFKERLVSFGFLDADASKKADKMDDAKIQDEQRLTAMQTRAKANRDRGSDITVKVKVGQETFSVQVDSKATLAVLRHHVASLAKEDGIRASASFKDSSDKAFTLDQIVDEVKDFPLVLEAQM